jgi:hypothetical protein
MESAEGAIRDAALCSEEQFARQLISRWEAYAVGHQSRDKHSLWSEVYIRGEALSQPVR